MKVVILEPPSAPVATTPAPAEARPKEARRAPSPSSRPEPERPRRPPTISVGPITPPATGIPPSALPDAARYVDAYRLPSYPRLVAPLSARYPRLALEQRRTGVVVLQLMIDENGRVAEALALPGANEEFVAAAREALREARFAAGRTASGKDVPARAYFAVSFVLE
jgi:TonB family protein